MLNARLGQAGPAPLLERPAVVAPASRRRFADAERRARNNGAMWLTLFYALRVDRRLFALCTAFGLLQLLKHFEVLLGVGRFAEFSQNIA